MLTLRRHQIQPCRGRYAISAAYGKGTPPPYDNVDYTLAFEPAASGTSWALLTDLPMPGGNVRD